MNEMIEFPKKYKSKLEDGLIVRFVDYESGNVEAADIYNNYILGEYANTWIPCTDTESWEPYEEPTKLSSSGGSSDYYRLPDGAKQLQDLIEHHNMNAQRKEVFKAAWRVGSKEGNDELYDWNKIVYFALREIGRLSNRKDYVAIAKEIIGEQ